MSTSDKNTYLWNEAVKLCNQMTLPLIQNKTSEQLFENVQILRGVAVMLLARDYLNLKANGSIRCSLREYMTDITRCVDEHHEELSSSINQADFFPATDSPEVH